MIHDKVVFGGLVGTLGKIVMDIFQFPLWRIMLIKHPLAHYAASLFIDVSTIHHTLVGAVVSLLADYIYGVFWGILFVYLIFWVGRRNIIFKGLMYGALIWLFSFGFLRSLPVVKLREVVSSQALYYFFIHIVFGLSMAFFAKIFGERYMSGYKDKDG